MCPHKYLIIKKAPLITSPGFVPSLFVLSSPPWFTIDRLSTSMSQHLLYDSLWFGLWVSPWFCRKNSQLLPCYARHLWDRPLGGLHKELPSGALGMAQGSSSQRNIAPPSRAGGNWAVKSDTLTTAFHLMALVHPKKTWNWTTCISSMVYIESIIYCTALLLDTVPDIIQQRITASQVLEMGTTWRSWLSMFNHFHIRHCLISHSKKKQKTSVNLGESCKFWPWQALIPVPWIKKVTLGIGFTPVVDLIVLKEGFLWRELEFETHRT